MNCRRLTKVHCQANVYGVAMVEYVLVLPLVLLLILATAELGRGFLQYNTLTQTARDGARFIAELVRTDSGGKGVILLDPADRTAAQNLVAYGSIGNGGTPLLPGLAPGAVQVTTGGAAEKEWVNISVDYPYQSIFSNLPLFGYGPNIVPNFVFEVDVTMRVL